MRTHTNDFKNEISKMGKQINGKIYFYHNYNLITEDNNTIITEDNIKLISEQINYNDKELIDNELIYSMNLIKNGEFLHSLMKEFDFEAKFELKIGDIVNPYFGLLVNNNYEYLNYGNYIIYSKEYIAESQSWKYVCYDKMLYSMVQYKPLDITYPCTIREYLIALANRIGLIFTNASDTFTNYNQQVLEELFEGQNITYRDILDKLSEITASNIFINDNDELELGYPSETNDTIDEENLKDVNVNFGEVFGPINKVAITETDGGYEYSMQDDSSIEANGLTQVNIIDNIFAFNGNSEIIAQNILNKINGLSYSINDFSTTGICYYDFLDLFNVSIENNIYKCLLLNSEIKISEGLEEKIYTEKLEKSENESNNYKLSNITNKQVQFQINKQKGEIEARVEKNGIINAINLSEEGTQILANKLGLTATNVIDIIAGNTLNLTAKNIAIDSTNFKVDKDGNCTSNSFSSNNATITGGSLNITNSTGSKVLITLNDTRNNMKTTMKGSNILMETTASGGQQLKTNIDTGEIDLISGSYSNEVAASVINMEYGSSYTRITATGGVNHSSKEEYKKQIKEHNNNLELVKNVKVYSYLFKTENDNSKKHIGLIIGEKYNTPKEIISSDGNGINLNDMCGVMWGAIKEQQQIIETLQKQVQDLERKIK